MPRHLISQLAHVELLTPRPDQTMWFFKELLGLEESAREGQSMYLRGWGEFFHHSLKVTEAKQSGLGHAAWRADGPEALEHAVAVIEQSGLGEGWIDGDLGHGRAYQFRNPEGHLNEIFWEVERYQTPQHLRTTIKNHPQKYVGRGAAVRRLDHVNMFTTNVKGCRQFYQELGFNYHEAILADGSDFEIGAFLSATNISHDLGIVGDTGGGKARLNHIAYWQDTREEVLRTADIMRDQDIFIEFGPTRHGISEAFFLYVYEPGGNRIEIYSGGYLNFAPDWGPIIWRISEHPILYWGGVPPASLTSRTYGTPPVEPPMS